MDNNLLNSLREFAEQSVPREEGDYEKNGILYCGKCNTPKQTILKAFNGSEIKVMCLCKCAEQKRMESIKRENALRRENEIKILRKDAFPESDMQNWRFENDDGANKQISIAKNYAKNFNQMFKDKKGLLLFGNVGTGKTYMAACIVNALVDKGIPCLVTSFPRISNQLIGVYEKQEYLDSLNRYSLLVIDDLGSERDTSYMGEVVTNVIDSRYRSGKPLIVTTNLTADELKNPKDISESRVYSRLLEMCIPVEIKCYDRRKKKLIDEHDKYASLLGLEEKGDDIKNGIKQ